MFALYGTTPGEFSGVVEAWRSRVHAEDLAMAESKLQMAVEGQEEFNIEFRIVWPDGSIRYIRAISSDQRDESGKVARIIGTNLDITAQKEYESELTSREAKIRQIIDSEVDEAPTADAMARLPEDLVQQLQEATSRADYDLMLDLAAKIEAHDSSVGIQLRKMIEQFDYQSLVNILSRQNESDEHRRHLKQ